MSCWRIVPLDEAFYECSECRDTDDLWSREEEQRRPMTELKPSWWRRLAGDPKEPECPYHSAATIRVFCACGSELLPSNELRSQRPTGVGVAGSQASGKTTLLVAMIYSLHREAELLVSLLGLGTTEQRFAEISKRILQEGQLPEPSAPAGTASQDHYAWEVLVGQKAGRSRQARLLSIYDVAGESWESLVDEASSNLDRYLGQLGALALVLDGATIADDLEVDFGVPTLERPRRGDRGALDGRILRQLIDRTQNQTGKRPGLALVVSKLDFIWELEAYRTFDPAAGGEQVSGCQRQQLLRELLIQSGRKPLIMAAEKHFKRVGLFAVSSLGYRPSGSGEEGLRLDHPIQPQGVVELFLWLLGLKPRR